RRAVAPLIDRARGIERETGVTRMIRDWKVVCPRKTTERFMATASAPDDLVIVPLDEDGEDHLAPGGPQVADPIGRPPECFRGRVRWGYLLPVVAFHLTFPLAFVPWLFSWTGLILIPVGNYVFCSLGIGAGFHRLLTHRSFRCPTWVERAFALLGVCTLMEGPARWV